MVRKGILLTFFASLLFVIVVAVFSRKRIEEAPVLPQENLTLEVFRRLEDFRIVKSRVTLDPTDTLFYVDAWRSHWCTYYNDRAFYLTPRVNEVLHLARSRGFRAFHLHWKAHERDLDRNLRSEAKRRAQIGETPIINETWTDNSKNNSRYIPGFEDRCMLPGYERFGKTRDQKPHPTISVGSEDVIAFNFKSIANVAHYLNVSTVVLMGMHTNLCIRSAAMYLALVNISVGYVDSLLDAGYYFPGQRRHGVNSHSKMNDITFNYSITYHGWGINGFHLMAALSKLPSVAREPQWVMYPEAALRFKRFYAKS
jgi:hypothetical protein